MSTKWAAKASGTPILLLLLLLLLLLSHYLLTTELSRCWKKYVVVT